jgi:hypothetical protein
LVFSFPKAVLGVANFSSAASSFFVRVLSITLEFVPAVANYQFCLKVCPVS